MLLVPLDGDLVEGLGCGRSEVLSLLHVCRVSLELELELELQLELGC